MEPALRLTHAVPADYPSLASAGREAFEADKRRYGVGPSIYENPSFLLALLKKEDGTVQKLLAGNTLVGVVITFETAPDTRRIGCLCLPPAWQGRGYGSEAIRLLEAAYPAVKRWTLDTPADSERNRHFYEKAGYQVVGESCAPGAPALVLFEKQIDGHTQSKAVRPSKKGATQLCP
ncbi:MAG: GNAT family N-acetyltransferase [Eubacteriales bacterium]|nr:GNAT family N-acetyltransferase [Eubacteriales bacterium]